MRRRVSRIFWLCTLSLCLLGTGPAWSQGRNDDREWLPVSPEKLPKWRGFNLLEKFLLQQGNRPFEEDDFRMISEFGFNFVRLPMDYRTWIKDGNWESFNEKTLQEIDQAVAWGQKYGVHVCINFHRAPGYTVAEPREPKDLWTDADAQRVCALHWKTFAERYRGIPSTRLSFNLFNEPAGVSDEAYARVVRIMVDAIREVDPDRLIICDGLQWGQNPATLLKPLKVAQATRGYQPMEISHYHAGWVGGSDQYPDPQWPRVIPPNGMLLSPAKPEGATTIQINGPFEKQTKLRLNVRVVSVEADLIVTADGKPVFEKAFKSGPGQGEWKEAVYNDQYNIWQNVFDQDVVAEIPAGTKQVTIGLKSGDWLRLGEMGLTQGDRKEDVLPFRLGWSEKVPPFRYDPQAKGSPFVGLPAQDREWLWENAIAKWKSPAGEGIGVIVGEWGAFNETPHDVVLAWAEDNLQNWQKAEWGWALWNFRGSFGIMDSGRDDVEYENYQGHKLDRKYLELLQRY